MKVLFLRLFGVRVNEVDDRLTRVTIPKRREWMREGVIRKLRATAWRQDASVEVRPEGETTVIEYAGRRVEIRVVA